MAKRKRAVKGVDKEAVTAATTEAVAANVETTAAVEDTEAEAKAAADAAAKAAREKRAAEKAASLKVTLDGIKTKIVEVGAVLREAKGFKAAAIDMRGNWITLGELLSEARDANPSKQKFNAWITSEGLNSVADTNTRTDAIWLASLPQELLDLVPNTPDRVLANPKNIRKWWRDEARDVYEMAVSYDVEKPSDEDIPKEKAGDTDEVKESREKASDQVHDSLIDTFEALLEDKEVSTETKALVQARLDFVMANDPIDMSVQFAQFKGVTVKAGPFAETTVEDAVNRILTMMVRHPDYGDVWEMLKVKGDEFVTDTTAKAVEAEEAKAKAEAAKAGDTGEAKAEPVTATAEADEEFVEDDDEEAAA